MIIGAKNLKEGTLIEMVQKPADMERRPKDVDESDGRFLALYEGYLPACHCSRPSAIGFASPAGTSPGRAGECWAGSGEAGGDVAIYNRGREVTVAVFS